MTRADRIHALLVQAQLAESAAADARSAQQWVEGDRLRAAANVLVELADDLLMEAGR
jgi:hypothetical protein